METFYGKNNKKRYREKIYINGKEIKSPVFDKKSDAKLWKSKMKLERTKDIISLEKKILAKDILFEDYARSFLENQIRPKLAYKTYINYRSRLENHVFPIVSSHKISQISSVHGELLVKSLKEKGNNTGGINNVIRIFKTIMGHAHKEGLIHTNPLANFSQLKKEPLKEIYLTKEEVKELLAKNEGNDYLPMLIVAVNTGMRKGELAGLKWEKILFERNLIEVSATRDQFEFKETTKTGIKRYIPMNKVVRETLLDLKKYSVCDFVFCDGLGEPVDVHHLYRVFARMQKNANLKRNIRFHDLRHTFSSHFMMNGGNIYDLQKILGHSRTEMTMRYAHLSPDYLATTTSIVDFN